MRPIVLVVLLVSGVGSAQSTPDALKAKRCWEKTALALRGSTRPAKFGRDDAGYPPAFQPELVPLFFGDSIYEPAFANRFAGFVNAQWQREQSTEKNRNVPFLIAQYVVGHGLPWAQVFNGPFSVDFANGGGAVVQSTTGLGYFRVPEWQRQYAGNELAGYKLATAYRFLNNIVGVHLTPAANNTAGDASATGRAAPGCTGCHFTGPYALDLVARVLDRRQGFGDAITFTPSTDGPQQLFGKTVANDAELVELLVRSEAFTFNTCRLVFTFLYGRAESTCEAPIFEACVTAFQAQGTIQSAVMGIVSHPDYCQ